MLTEEKPLSWLITQGTKEYVKHPKEIPLPHFRKNGFRRGTKEYVKHPKEIDGKRMFVGDMEFSKQIADEFMQYEMKDIDVTRVYCDKPTKDQPVWSIGHPNENISEISEHKPDYRNENNKDLCGRVDLIAWYVPAHINPDNYGIHFDVGAVRKLAKELQSTDAHSSKISYGDWLIAAIETAFWHEITHAWIEDLVSLAENIDKTQFHHRLFNTRGSYYYTKTHKKYGSYIFMEEALCNTAATGMLNWFFDSHPQKDTILNSVKLFMKKQPRGYCDFLELSWYATIQDIFLDNMYHLLTRIYNIPPCTTREVIDLFFKSFNRIANIELFHTSRISFEYDREPYRDYSAYPLYLD